MTELSLSDDCTHLYPVVPLLGLLLQLLLLLLLLWLGCVLLLL